MMHRARSSIVEVPYCFSRSSVKFQGHMALKIVEFDPKWAFLDCNSSLNSPMAMKCCTKLETAKERCPIVFQGHLSNFKVTRYKTSPILTQIGRFRTIGQSQLSNPSDLPCYWNPHYSNDIWPVIHYSAVTWPCWYFFFFFFERDFLLSHFIQLYIIHITNYWQLNCFFKSSFRLTAKKTSKLCISGLLQWESRESTWFPSQRASDAENLSIRHISLYTVTHVL